MAEADDTPQGEQPLTPLDDEESLSTAETPTPERPEPEPMPEAAPPAEPVVLAEAPSTPVPEAATPAEPVVLTEATPAQVPEPVVLVEAPSTPVPEAATSAEPVVLTEATPPAPTPAPTPTAAPGSEAVAEAPPAAASPSGTEGPTPPAPPAPGKAKRPTGVGKILEGVVTAVTADVVELTLDDGRAAVISRQNFSPDNQDPSKVLSPGDRAFGAELSREDPKQRVVLSRIWALKRQAWDHVVQIAGLNEPLTGKVVSVGAKGVVVDVGVRGFVPTSHLDLDPVTDLKQYLGQTVELKVLEADPLRERLVLSRRSLLLKEQRKKTHDLLSSLQPGETCRGKVTSITNYGAFVDIGGVNGLVHLSEMSWQRVRRPSDIVAVGQEVEVQVMEVKAKKRRISLSIRRLTPDPLLALKVGEVLVGSVTRLVDFGAFVSIGDLEGLVHLSELAEYRVSTPEEVVAPGDQVGVKILKVDSKRRRVELSIRQAAEFGG